MRDIQYALKVSKTKILKALAKFSLVIEPKLKSYNSVQIDELWSYVKIKKPRAG